MALKIPGSPVVQTPVKSLGRLDPGAPVAVASAQAGAALAWQGAFNRIGQVYNQITSDLYEAEGLQKVGVQTTDDERKLALTEAYLQQPAARHNDPTAPESAGALIKSYKDGLPEGHELKPDDVAVPMYEIANNVWGAEVDAMTQNAYTQLPDRYHAKYNNAMGATVVNGARKVASKSSTDHFDALKSQQLRLYEGKLNLLDETGATEAVHEGYLNGLFVQSERDDMLQQVGPTIDYMTADKNIREARTAGDLEAAEDAWQGSRVTVEMRQKLSARGEAQVDAIAGYRTRLHADTYQDGMRRFSEGGLTQDWITTQLIEDKIAAPQAGTLLTRMRTEKALVSNSAVMDDFQGRIASLRFADVNFNETLDDAAHRIQQDMLREFSGVDDYGNRASYGPRLTGDDYLAMTARLDAELARVSDANPAYKDVIESIKLRASFTDMMTTFEGKENNINAYLDGKTALDEYIQAAGGHANPREWYAEHGERYTIETYRKLSTDGFALKFPQYDTDKWRTEQGMFDLPAIREDALKQWQSKSIDEREYSRLMRILRQLPDTLEPKSTTLGGV